MSEFDENKIRRMDFSVLLIFLKLIRLGKASQVASELGLTPSSISHALARLREIFDDPLFIRQPHGMMPTNRAKALEPIVAAMIESLNSAIVGEEPFEPAKASGILRLSAFDIEMVSIVPELLSRVAKQAPGIRLTAKPFGREQALTALEQGETDLALGFFWNLSNRFESVSLYDEEYLVVMRRDHPAASGELTLSRYLDSRHLVVSPSGDLHGIVDKILAAEGQKRQVLASVPQFFPALATLARSDLIATLPSRLSRSYAEAFGLECRSPPLNIRKFTVSAVRHIKDRSSGLHDWTTSLLKEITASR